MTNERLSAELAGPSWRNRGDGPDDWQFETDGQGGGLAFRYISGLELEVDYAPDRGFSWRVTAIYDTHIIIALGSTRSGRGARAAATRAARKAAVGK